MNPVAVSPADRPLIVHVVFRFAVGGLENGVVNLINRMDPKRWRHAVVSLTDVDESFARRIRRDDVPCIALHKAPGHGIWIFPKLWRTFRAMRPSLVHTRNLAALEAQVPAWMSGVHARVHGEHGRDIDDLHGENRRHILVRRLYRPWVQHYVALSRDLADYLRQQVRIPPTRQSQIYNGVDTDRFFAGERRTAIAGCPFDDPGLWLVGTVGRMQTVKAQPLLARAFALAVTQQPVLRARLRLVLVGDGPLRADCEDVLRAAGVADLAWFAGGRDDVPDVMRGLDCFVLPSLAEGVSNTILEAMASGLPVVATRVGANADLVVDGETGFIVPPGDPQALADRIAELACAPETAATMGRAGCAVVKRKFSLAAMVRAYEAVYERLLGLDRRN